MSRIGYMPNVFDPEWDGGEEREGFVYRDAALGWQGGAERLGASLYELAPGSRLFPYHFHMANEEMLVVLSGRPHLRTPEGWRELDEGEVVFFCVGERGAHQVENRRDAPIRLLMVSEMVGPEIAVYPDSGKLGVRDPAPGSREKRMRENFRLADAVDYWDGESPAS
jgi:uncharacterized cupin superfamily protein